MINEIRVESSCIIDGPPCCISFVLVPTNRLRGLLRFVIMMIIIIFGCCYAAAAAALEKKLPPRGWELDRQGVTGTNFPEIGL